jgi:MFS-type transporter involved in bile tolerance (Atg22 family)
MMDPWWTSQQAALIGGLGGGFSGLLGGLLGVFMGRLAPRGSAKRFVISFHTGIVLLGVVVLIVGIVALVVGQPYDVWYPLLLLGAIMACIFGGLLPVTRSVYKRAEQNKLEAEELRRG